VAGVGGKEDGWRNAVQLFVTKDPRWQVREEKKKKKGLCERVRGGVLVRGREAIGRECRECRECRE